MPHDVFISYSSKDKTVADALCATLEAKRIRCWIAPRDVLAGVPYAEALIDGLNGACVFVLVFSSEANMSPSVAREVERACSKGLVNVPVRIEDVPMSKQMEFYLSSQHWLDALTPPVEQHLENLAGTVSLLLERMAVVNVASEPPASEADRQRKEAAAAIASVLRQSITHEPRPAPSSPPMTPPPSRPVSRSTRSSHTRGISASTAWASKISKRVSASRRTNSSSIAPAVPSWP